MNTLAEVREALKSCADPRRATHASRYFKTGPGEYGEGDRFHGNRVPDVRRIAKALRGAPTRLLRTLLRSPWHEERQAALFAMVDGYRRGSPSDRQEIFDLYLAELDRVNNWDLVDGSSPGILGAHLLTHPERMGLLLQLSRSASVWDRRAAVLATLSFIKSNDFQPTLRLAESLLDDPHDLIHKAVGWMLREAGQRDLYTLYRFIHAHHFAMPRTMLRYAIEKQPNDIREAILTGGTDAIGPA